MDKIEIKASLAVDEAGAITGTAWPFGSADRVGDVIEKGAFNAPSRLPMLFAHDQAQAIGVWESIEETPAGLTVKGRLLIDDVARAREVRALVREGAVTGLSIGFVTKKAASRRGGGRNITALDLHEISVVPIPSHPGARITSAKSAVNTGGQMAETATDTAPDYAELETKLAEVAGEVKAFGKLVERLDRMEAKLNRPANDNAGGDDLERKAFELFIRRGKDALSADEIKTLVIANDTSGGYFAPPEFTTEILKRIVEFSPVRQAARVGATAAGSVVLPKRTGTPTAHWTGETEERKETGMTYGQLEIPVHESACYVDVSRRLLEDSAVSIEGEVSGDLSEEFGRLESVAFVSGDGIKKPMGFMVDDKVTSFNNGHATNLNPDSLISFLYSLQASYRNRGAFMMNGSTLAVIRKLKDGQGNYLWQPSYQAGQPETILGRPVIEAIDMPDVAANAFPIIYGDFNAGYRIYDRVSLSLLRDDYTQATHGLVRFHARRRVGGGVVRPEALKKFKMAA